MGASTVSGAASARLERLRQRFERWRGRRRSVRARIPEPLWDSAVTLAQACGIHRTSKALRLDYYALKKRVEKDLAARRGRPTSSAAAAPGAAEVGSPVGTTFLELPAGAWPVGGECTVELEEVGGAKMRIHLKGFAAPDVAALSRSFWDSVS